MKTISEDYTGTVSDEKMMEDFNVFLVQFMLVLQRSIVISIVIRFVRGEIAGNFIATTTNQVKAATF